MNRTMLAACGLFEGMSYNEISTLLGCVGARYRRVLPGLAVTTGSLIAVLDGALTTGGEIYTAGTVLLSAGGIKAISALRPSEALFISPSRLLNTCKNACVPHKKANSNLMRLCLARGGVSLPLTTYAKKL